MSARTKLGSADYPTRRRNTPITSIAAPPLYPTMSDLAEPTRVEAIGLLNKRLADCIDGVDKWLWFDEAHQQAPSGSS